MLSAKHFLSGDFSRALQQCPCIQWSVELSDTRGCLQSESWSNLHSLSLMPSSVTQHPNGWHFSGLSSIWTIRPLLLLDLMLLSLLLWWSEKHGIQDSWLSSKSRYWIIDMYWNESGPHGSAYYSKDSSQMCQNQVRRIHVKYKSVNFHANPYVEHKSDPSTYHHL